MKLEPWYVAEHWKGKEMTYTAQQWDPTAYKFRGRTFTDKTSAEIYVAEMNRKDGVLL